MVFQTPPFPPTYMTLASVGWLTAISIRPDTTVVPLKIGAGPSGLQLYGPWAPQTFEETPAPNSNSISATMVLIIPAPPCLMSGLTGLNVQHKSLFTGYLHGNAF